MYLHLNAPRRLEVPFGAGQQVKNVTVPTRRSQYHQIGEETNCQPPRSTDAVVLGVPLPVQMGQDRRVDALVGVIDEPARCSFE